MDITKLHAFTPRPEYAVTINLALCWATLVAIAP